MVGNDDAYYERAARWSSTPRYRNELELLINALALSPGATVLDIGCGTGSVLRALNQRQLRAIGVDGSESCMRFNAEPGVASARAESLPFADRSFDACVLMHVFAHLEQPLPSLREALRVLRPGGRLAVITPNPRFLALYRLVPRWWNGYRPDLTVERHVNANQLSRLMSEVGFEIVSAAEIGRRPPLVPLNRFRERALVVARRPRPIEADTRLAHTPRL